MNIPQFRLLISSPSNNSASLLPSEYQQVEYIESVKNSTYILIPFVANDESEIEFKICNTISNQASNAVYGSYIGFGFKNNGNYGVVRFGSTQSYETSIKSNSEIFETVRLSKEGFFVDGVRTDIEFAQKQWTDTRTISVFAYANGNNYYVANGIRGAEFIYREAGIVQLHLIPCYRKSDGVIGMYDLCGTICPLTGTPFYINEGKGEFLKGADV